MITRKPVLAWYFSDKTKRLRYGDGREIVLGVEHTVKGYPEPCRYGLHGSESILDALEYAPGPIIWRVELSGRIKRGHNKIAATRRRYVAGGIDISDTLRRFACDQALSVAHLWDMPAIVREYLETMDESKRVAALDAAGGIARFAWDAARVAWAASWDDAFFAARVGARVATRDGADKSLETMVLDAIGNEANS